MNTVHLLPSFNPEPSQFDVNGCTLLTRDGHDYLLFITRQSFTLCASEEQRVSLTDVELHVQGLLHHCVETSRAVSDLSAKVAFDRARLLDEVDGRLNTQ